MFLSRLVKLEISVFAASGLLWLGCFLAALVSKGGAALLSVPFTILGAILVAGVVFALSRSLATTAMAFGVLLVTSWILVMIGGTFGFAAWIFGLPFTSILGFLSTAAIGFFVAASSGSREAAPSVS